MNQTTFPNSGCEFFFHHFPAIFLLVRNILVVLTFAGGGEGTDMKYKNEHIIIEKMMAVWLIKTSNVPKKAKWKLTNRGAFPKI